MTPRRARCEWLDGRAALDHINGFRYEQECRSQPPIAWFARQAQPVETPVDSTPNDLTARQAQVLTLVAQGLTYPQIGEALNLSEATVRYHMGQILERLHLTNRAQVIAYAARHGLAHSHPE